VDFFSCLKFNLMIKSRGMIQLLCGAETMPVFIGNELGRCFEQVVVRSAIPIAILLLSILIFAIRYSRRAREAKLRALGYLPFEAAGYKQSPELLAIKTRNIQRLSIVQTIFSVGQVVLAVESVARAGASRPEFISSGVLLLCVWVR
jgi:hypothetical protein